MDKSSNKRLETLKNYIEEDPADEFSRYLLALEFIKQGDDHAAKLQMSYIFKHHPDYLPNYYHYGKLLERLGDITSAVAIYKAGVVIAESKSDHHTKNELESALEMCDE